jgi:hypothetical protein
MEEFICVHCHCEKNLKMKINEHYKKGCDRVVDSEWNILKLKLYPPLKNTIKDVYIAKGGNILEYRAKANALSKPRGNHPSTTLVLHPEQTSEHKCKKEKASPSQICDEGQEEFVVFHKKCLMKPRGQAIKQVLKLERIFEHLVSPEPIIQEKSQHIGIGSHLLYLICNIVMFP